MSDEPTSSGQSEGPSLKVRVGVGAVLTTLALAVFVVHLLGPGLKIDTTALGLLALAALPWLGYFRQVVQGFRSRRRSPRNTERDSEGRRR